MISVDYSNWFVRTCSHAFSRHTRNALIAAITLYLAFGAAHNQWRNLSLVEICLLAMLFLPFYLKFLNVVEDKVNLVLAVVTLGRVSRFIFQYAYILVVFMALDHGGVLNHSAIIGVGGVAGLAFFTTIAAQGALYVAIATYNRGFGSLEKNIVFAAAVNILVTAAATTGLQRAKVLFVSLSLTLGAVMFGVGIFSDLRARFYPLRGVGVFFGTFNPFHLTHVAIVKKALDERGLSKIYIYPAAMPRVDATALERGEIRVASVDAGLQIMEKTEKAHFNSDYFHFGNCFYPPETRRLMVELAIAEAGLKERVEVLWLPDVYLENGFYGIIDHVKQLHPADPIHGLHGSDSGGMAVRSIYDESGWIYPMPVRRRDGVSSTAVRKGAAGMTSNAVTRILAAFRSGTTKLELDGRFYTVGGGNVELQPEESKASRSERSIPERPDIRSIV